MSNDSTGSRPTSWFDRFGGRKQVNALLGVVLLTVMAARLDASFEAYALYLTAFLLGAGTLNVIQKRGAR